MNVLVVYGSARGGTADIAEAVGHALIARGCAADVHRAESMWPATGYDAVVVGGALYASRWHRAARRFVQRRASDLRKRPVWFFSSGPLDDSASKAEIPPTRQVSRLMELVGARGHMTFGGRLLPGTHGLLARAIATTRNGDWRDMDHVRSWAAGIADVLHAERPATPSAGHPATGQSAAARAEAS